MLLLACSGLSDASIIPKQALRKNPTHFLAIMIFPSFLIIPILCLHILFLDFSFTDNNLVTLSEIVFNNHLASVVVRTAIFQVIKQH